MGECCKEIDSIVLARLLGLRWRNLRSSMQVLTPWELEGYNCGEEFLGEVTSYLVTPLLSLL